MLQFTALTDQMETGTRSGSCSSTVVIINDTMAVILALALYHVVSFSIFNLTLNALKTQWSVLPIHLKGNFGAKMSIFQKKGRTSLLQIFVFSLLYRTN